MRHKLLKCNDFNSVMQCLNMVGRKQKLFYITITSINGTLIKKIFKLLKKDFHAELFGFLLDFLCFVIVLEKYSIQVVF